ncbi:MAG: cytochrome-c peroxidase [Niabella sp.]
MKVLFHVKAIFFIAGFLSCGKEDFIQKQQPDLVLNTPSHFPTVTYRLENNTITKEKFELGKKLFYDKILSANNTVSCASCHRQSAAFSDAGNTVSTGINGHLGTRNSPSIFNLAWNPLFMWDGGIADLDLQAIAPLTNHVEMGTDAVSDILQKLNNNTAYRTLFKKAFNTESVTSVPFLKALSQFMIMCVSDQSKYDSVMRKQAVFTTVEQHGYQVFQQHCSSCHTEPLFTNNTFGSIGTTSLDSGRYLVTLLEKDLYTFKVPTLRNLKYTAPYMHNGSINNLDAVIDLIIRPKSSANVHESVKNGINISNQEKQDLISFLNTLNDEKFITNPLLSN